MLDDQLSVSEDSLDIAIISLAGRFPGAANVDEFWANLRDGVESITSFTDEELLAFGVNRATLRHPNFIKAGAILRDVDQFDASFFGYSPREAELIDPQHRLFLECAWEALESAAYDSERYEGLIGVFAGTSLSTYLLFNLLADPAVADSEDTFQVMIGNDKDFVATRVSYKLNLRGPSINVQTGCSTSLVGVHLACQSLLSYQCDLALAGGVSVNVPQRTGYYYQEGGICSPDGHCRPFDAQAQGTIFGSGAGVVLLKRLDEAIRDGDTIHAVIKGSAVNNDGAIKIGYTAPSVDGQAEVILRAQTLSRCDARSITYIETHGTGTDLGDPIEISALTKAFRASTAERQFCAVGSVKSNIGHLDAAAGVASLIKTVLALKHRELPASLNFEEPNPQIEFSATPFYVNRELKRWEVGPGELRRAGVSSFGIGGTNAHLIVEEAPVVVSERETREDEWRLLLLSARSAAALDRQSEQLLTYLREHPEVDLGHVAYTLAVGRRAFKHRRVVVCRTVAGAIAALEQADPECVFSAVKEGEEPQVAFLFPGGGAQYVQMGRALYDAEPVFRHHLDVCARILDSAHDYDLLAVIYPPKSDSRIAAARLQQTSVALPALFAVEYALAQLWIAWGVRPHVMIGHSLGEYAAAALAEVFTLEDAIALVVERGRLFDQLPEGAMLSVPLSEAELRPWLQDGLSLAAVNAPELSVVSGPTSSIAELAQRLDEEGIDTRRLHINVAAHSSLVEPILNQFREFTARLPLRSPQIPFVSNVTGQWIQDEETCSADYWARHLRSAVRFGEGLETILKEPGKQVLLEVGPGQTLSSLARLQTGARGSHILTSLRHPHDPQPDVAFLQKTLGKLWLAGVAVSWADIYAGERRRRIPLPTYPFERQRYWLDPPSQDRRAPRRKTSGKEEDVAEWFYLPAWKRTMRLRSSEQDGASVERQCWIVFADRHGIGSALAERLKSQGHDVFVVNTGERFERVTDQTFALNPRHRVDYGPLFEELSARGRTPRNVLHCWSIDSANEQGFADEQARGFYSLVFLAQALAEINGPVKLGVITNHIQEVETSDVVHPEKATLLAPCKTIPQEFESISCQCIDIGPAPMNTASLDAMLDELISEITVESTNPMIALRGRQRLVQAFEPVRVEAGPQPGSSLRHKGTYVIIGGLGVIGLLLAEYLARTVQARLVLTGRSQFPARESWSKRLDAHDEDVSRKIRRLQKCEELGAEIEVVAADVTSEGEMRGVFEQMDRVDGVFHVAGLTGAKAAQLISEIEPAGCEPHFQSKVHGLYVLEKVLRGRDTDFCLCFSSNAAVLGGLGLTGYAAANLFMDAFASRQHRSNGVRWMSVNWDGWPAPQEASYQTSIDQYAMTADEGIEAVQRILDQSSTGQLVVSTGDLQTRLNTWININSAQRNEPAAGEKDDVSLHSRPALGTAYVPASNRVEQTIIDIWQQLLGIEQVGINDNFFDLGGNSLIGLKVISRLKKELNKSVPIVALFEGPTVSALAKIVKQEQEINPDYQQSRGRGEKRRELAQRRRHASVAEAR